MGAMFVLKGKGWGHGVGLCQIGAAVMASRGKNYQEILEHYYPGTSTRDLEEFKNKHLNLKLAIANSLY